MRKLAIAVDADLRILSRVCSVAEDHGPVMPLVVGQGTRQVDVDSVVVRAVVVPVVDTEATVIGCRIKADIEVGLLGGRLSENAGIARRLQIIALRPELNCEAIAFGVRKCPQASVGMVVVVRSELQALWACRGRSQGESARHHHGTGIDTRVPLIVADGLEETCGCGQRSEPVIEAQVGNQPGLIPAQAGEALAGDHVFGQRTGPDPALVHSAVKAPGMLVVEVVGKVGGAVIVVCRST